MFAKLKSLKIIIQREFGNIVSYILSNKQHFKELSIFCLDFTNYLFVEMSIRLNIFICLHYSNF